MQYIIVCCNVLQCHTVRCSVFQYVAHQVRQRILTIVLQRVRKCFSLWHLLPQTVAIGLRQTLATSSLTLTLPHQHSNATTLSHQPDIPVNSVSHTPSLSRQPNLSVLISFFPSTSLAFPPRAHTKKPSSLPCDKNDDSDLLTEWATPGS